MCIWNRNCIAVTTVGGVTLMYHEGLSFRPKASSDFPLTFKVSNLTLPTKIRLVKAMVFPVVMYGCESWTVKKAENRRIDAFEL